MACRKAADRALTELSGWMEKQRDEDEARMAQIRHEQEQIWTPLHVFDTCCVQWLADGWETTTTVGQRISSGGGGGSTGCSGGCGKAHPRIVFDWQQRDKNVDGTAVATLSHKLDPFLRYFERLCEEGLATTMDKTDKDSHTSSTDCATSSSSKKYLLNGFLQAHLDRLQETCESKSHLYKVASPDALSASQRAHERHMDREEQLERDAKRRRKNGDTDEIQSADDSSVFEKAMTIICSHPGLLLAHLDLAEIGLMRLTGRPSDNNNIVAKVAASMARTRLRQVRLSYSVLVDGMERFRETTSPTIRRGQYRRGSTSIEQQPPPQRVPDNNQEDEGCILISENELEDGHYGQEMRGSIFEMYTIRGSRLALTNSANHDDDLDRSEEGNSTSLAAASNCSSPPAPHRFVPKEEREFHWESRVLSLANINSVTRSAGGDFGFDYRGHVIRVYLEDCSTTTTAMADRPPERDCLFLEQLEVARYYIHPHGLSEGVHTMDKFTCEVTATDDRELPTNCVQYRGSFRVREIKFDFGDLLGVYVRKKLPLEKQKMQDIGQKRPVTRSEKEYVKALAKAARDAPGSSSAFRGMKGW
jgi:hypothetical protein